MLFHCSLLALSMITCVHTFAIDNGVIESPSVQCSDNTVTFSIRTRQRFTGNVFVKGKYDIPLCRQEYYQNRFNGASFNINIGDCGMRRIRQLQPHGMNYIIVFVVSFHGQFITKVDRAYNVRCFYAQIDKAVTAQLDVSMIPTTDSNAATMVLPNCGYSVRADTINGPIVRFARVGQRLVHRWQCDNIAYGMLVKNCFVNDGKGISVRVLDARGCPVFSPVVQGNLIYQPTQNLAYVEVWAYKFPDRSNMFFQCQIQICQRRENECVGITPPVCPTVNGPSPPLTPLAPNAVFGNNPIIVQPYRPETAISLGIARNGYARQKKTNVTASINRKNNTSTSNISKGFTNRSNNNVKNANNFGFSNDNRNVNYNQNHIDNGRYVSSVNAYGASVVNPSNNLPVLDSQIFNSQLNAPLPSSGRLEPTSLTGQNLSAVFQALQQSVNHNSHPHYQNYNGILRDAAGVEANRHVDGKNDHKDHRIRNETHRTINNHANYAGDSGNSQIPTTRVRSSDSGPQEQPHSQQHYDPWKALQSRLSYGTAAALVSKRENKTAQNPSKRLSDNQEENSTDAVVAQNGTSDNFAGRAYIQKAKYSRHRKRRPVKKELGSIVKRDNSGSVNATREETVLDVTSELVMLDLDDENDKRLEEFNMELSTNSSSQEGSSHHRTRYCLSRFQLTGISVAGTLLLICIASLIAYISFCNAAQNSSRCPQPAVWTRCFESSLSKHLLKIRARTN